MPPAVEVWAEMTSLLSQQKQVQCNVLHETREVTYAGKHVATWVFP